MQVKLYYQLTIRDAEGRVLRRTRRRRAHSYVRQFADSLYCLMLNANVTNVRDTSNALRTLEYNTAEKMAVSGPVSASLYGPMVGTGSTAVDISDYALAAQIVHGTGSGQFSHLATTFTAVSVAGQTATWKVARIFNNSSGASITIQEVGLYMRHNDPTTPRYYLIVRDLVSGGFAVPNGGSATLEYTFSVTT